MWVFLLDDHEPVRRGLRELLEGEGDIEAIGEAGTASAASARIPALRPDVAILDARLPMVAGSRCAVMSALPTRTSVRSYSRL